MMKCGIALLNRFNKIDRIPYFDTCPPLEDSTFIIRYLSASGGFDIRFSEFLSLIKLAAFQASGSAEP